MRFLVCKNCLELFNLIWNLLKTQWFFRIPKEANRSANNGLALITSAPMQGVYGMFIDGNCVECGWRIDSICILVNLLYPCVSIFVRWE